jgi:ribonucleoside-triphosphate reductase
MQKSLKSNPLPCNERTEVYSRVVGYFRPVQNWNEGKKAEFSDRVTYDTAKNEDEK